MLVVNDFAKLLQDPGCRGIGCDIEMHEASAGYLHHDKHLDELKADANRDEEITSQHAVGMIADKCHPSLGGDRVASAAFRILRQILPDRARRDLNPKHDKEFGGYSFLPLGGIISSHGADELTKVFGNPGSADGSRFATPEQFEPLALPTGQGLRSNHDQGFLPIKQSCR